MSQTRSYEVTEAISALINQQPFFAVILIDLLKITESDSIKTAGTNGRDLIINPEFFKKLNVQERMFVLAHEVLHVIMQHPARGTMYADRGVGPDLKEWSHKRWNCAADYIINDALVADKVGRMPVGGLYHPDFKKDMIADEVYEKLPDDEDDSQNWDEHLPGKEQDAPTKPEIQRVLKSAESAAKSMGKMPGSMQRVVDDWCEPQVDWRDYLRKVLTAKVGRDEVTWARPNRRKLAVAPHVYWPGRASSQAAPIAVEIDTSGSISERELKVFMGELHGMLSSTPPEKIYLMYVDARLHNDEVHEFDDPNELLSVAAQAGGGGGTDMTVAFGVIEERALPVNLLIVFTDGYTPFGQPPDGYDVVWCITTADITAPWGTTVHVEIPH